MLPPINTLDYAPLHVTADVKQMVQVCNSTRTKQSHAITFIIVNITHLDIILDMAWLQI